MNSLFNESFGKICYIIGACPCEDIEINKNASHLIICADGGLKHLEKKGIVPHVIMGDFDSLGYVPKGENIFVFPSEKDDSDVCMAIKYGFEKGYKSFVIYGGFGGRFDHTFGNIQLLSYIAERGGRGWIFGDKTAITAIKDGEISVSGKGYISVFSLSEKCFGVTIKNLKYTLENAELTNTFPLGLSNEFLPNETSAFLRVEKGTLLLIINDASSLKIL